MELVIDRRMKRQGMRWCSNSGPNVESYAVRPDVPAIEPPPSVPGEQLNGQRSPDQALCFGALVTSVAQVSWKYNTAPSRTHNTHGNPFPAPLFGIGIRFSDRQLSRADGNMGSYR